jgi:hypothetical protein
LSQEETKPEARSMIQYPKEVMKKKEPAWSCPTFKSFSMVGIKGARTVREMKFKKKIPTRKIRGPT